MLPQRAVHKLGRHLNGLDNWPMSASYPQESGEIEFKQLLRSMEDKNKAEDKVDMAVTLDVENKEYKGGRIMITSCLNFMCKDCEQDEEEDPAADIDDVD